MEDPAVQSNQAHHNLIIMALQNNVWQSAVIWRQFNCVNNKFSFKRWKTGKWCRRDAETVLKDVIERNNQFPFFTRLSLFTCTSVCNISCDPVSYGRQVLTFLLNVRLEGQYQYQNKDWKQEETAGLGLAWDIICQMLTFTVLKEMSQQIWVGLSWSY